MSVFTSLSLMKTRVRSENREVSRLFSRLSISSSFNVTSAVVSTGSSMSSK
ncbi:hypothetical protein D3C77_390550 [compost metagenome]